MPHENKEETFSSQHIADALARFMYDDLTVSEGAEIVEHLRLARRQVTPRLLSLLGSSSVRERDMAIVLLGMLGDSGEVEHIRPLIADPSLDDDFKLKLISLVTQLDPGVDTAVLFDHIQDPYGALERSHREHLQLLRTPMDLARWLDMMAAHMSADARINLCETSTQIDDVAAVPLLICLCYDRDDEVALAAMDAVERYKDARALPALAELAAHHPTPAVRMEARKSADRLRVRASLVPQVESIPPPPLYACYLTTIDGSGGQIAFIVREHEDDSVDTIDVMFNDREGIKECFGARIRLSELVEMLDAMAQEDISTVYVSHARCLRTLDWARDITWKAGRLLPMTYVAWRPTIEHGSTEDDEQIPEMVIAPESRKELLDHCYELLLQDEFTAWFFNPDEIGDLVDRYLLLAPEEGAEIEAPALRQLLQAGVQEIVTDNVRDLIRGRLLRVAPLLREIYEDDEIWQWAIVAAEALDAQSGLSRRDHPLLLGMVACSLENAMGEMIEWPTAQVVAPAHSDRRGAPFRGA
jgi:hypothetical protein